MSTFIMEREKKENEIWLQGKGWNQAVLAGQLKPGMVTVWNYGATETIEDVKFTKTGKTIVVSIICESGYKATRRLRADRLVGVSA